MKQQERFRRKLKWNNFKAKFNYYGSRLHSFFVKRKVKRFLLKENNLKPTFIDRIRTLIINRKNKKILKR